MSLSTSHLLNHIIPSKIYASDLSRLLYTVSLQLPEPKLAALRTAPGVEVTALA